MKKILLDGKEVQTLVPESLPMLIHGAHGSGASLYTVCLAAKWFSQGYKVLFLCGYSMAEEAFAEEVGSDYPDTHFYTKEKVKEFLAALEEIDSKTIVVVKNIELFEHNVFEAVSSINNLIISGDVESSKVKDLGLQKKFTSEVYFSPLEGKNVPPLEKFQGVVLSGDYRGITTLST